MIENEVGITKTDCCLDFKNWQAVAPHSRNSQSVKLYKLFLKADPQLRVGALLPSRQVFVYTQEKIFDKWMCVLSGSKASIHCPEVESLSFF